MTSPGHACYLIILEGNRVKGNQMFLADRKGERDAITVFEICILKYLQLGIQLPILLLRFLHNNNNLIKFANFLQNSLSKFKEFQSFT